MSPHVLRRSWLLTPLSLVALAGCQQDVNAPPLKPPAVHLAQGDNGVWTVNSLADPGSGVCDDTECTFREAIAAASTGARIVFAPGLQGDIDLTAGQLQILGKDLRIDGDGRIRVDAQRASRVLSIAGVGPAMGVTLKGITLINGLTAGNGGGLLISDADAVLDHVVVSNNESSAGDGGGIESYRGNLTLQNSTVAGNISPSLGGGIYAPLGTLTVIASTISGNQANNGGGIYTGVSTEITASTISGNRANDGGGMVVVNSTAVLRSSTIVKNTAGDLYDVDGLQVKATNGTVSKASLANTILAGNVRVSSPSSSSNCGTISDVNSTAIIASLGYNLAPSSCFAVPAAGDVPIADLQVFTEVLEEQLKNNGGPTLTHALIARGRAVDVGYCPGETTDQRGFTRPVDDPAIANARDGCDIGAYELAGPVVATADLMVSQAVDKTSAKQGELLTYFVRVQNLGPQTAPDVGVNDVLSSGVTFVEARVNKGTITAPPKGETGTVTWRLGDMLSQANEVAEIRVTVLVKGKTTITNTATVTGNVVDPNKANDSASITVSVVAGSSGKGPSKP